MLSQTRGNRVLQYLLVLVTAITINFLLPRYMPGNPLTLLAGVDVGQMTPEQLQEGFERAYGHLYGYRSIFKRLFPFARSGLFYGIQNYGFRQGWKKTIGSL